MKLALSLPRSWRVRTGASCLVLFATLQSGSLPVEAAQTVLDVADYGAKGDAVLTLASTVQDSTTVSLAPTNSLGAGDVGKLIELFGAGPQTSGTNHQDLVASIQAVTNATNITISVPAGATTTGINCTFGTQNAAAFQNCVNAATGTNTDVLVPAGIYLLVPPKVLDPNFVMQNYADGAPTVVIQKGGLRILGADPSQTILLGNGAWQLRTNYVHRGFMFWLAGPAGDSNPLVFENLTMDGGVQQGHQAQTGFLAQAPAAAGWDVTHGAVVDAGPLPVLPDKRFVNCRFVHWRGEMVKSVTTYDSGMIVVTNCSFIDGNGSGFNFNWTPHRISNCLFSNLDMAMEYYVGTMRSPSVFENSTLANLRQGIVLVGGLAGSPSPGYTIQGNQFLTIGSTDVLLGPACNVKIVGNLFSGATFGISTDGSAYQGTDFNHDITVCSNTFDQTYYAINIGSSGADRVENMLVISNQASNCTRFACGYGWSSNVVLRANTSVGQPNMGNVNGGALVGQWFFDDPSDNFYLWWDYGYPSVTNIVSYAFGMRHVLYAGSTGIVFAIDDRSPWQIPPGAQLVLTNMNSVGVTILPSLRNPDAGTVVLNPNSSLNFMVQSNSFVLVTPPLPPQDLRLIGPP